MAGIDDLSTDEIRKLLERREAEENTSVDRVADRLADKLMERLGISGVEDDESGGDGEGEGKPSPIRRRGYFAS